MAGRIIQLTEPRRIVEPPFIDTSIRADIGDYGPPGHHLHGPLALKGRARAQALGIAGARDGDGEDGGGVPACFGREGRIAGTDESVAATTIVVLPSERIEFPFVLTHVSALIDKALATDVRLLVKISDDNDTTGGERTTGTDIVNVERSRGRLGLTNIVREWWPNHRVLNPPKYIKLVMNNNDATATAFNVYYEYILFDV